MKKPKKDNIERINKKQKQNEYADKQVRDYLKPQCEEQLSHEEYPQIKK